MNSGGTRYGGVYPIPSQGNSWVMTETTSATESLWLDTVAATNYPQLAGDIEVDVAVIGGGVAGLTTALLLKRQGARVAVLEAGRVGGGVTGCTTAKVTALQATVYTKIHQRHGDSATATYAEASVVGVEQLASIVAAESIDCDLERRDAFTFAAQPDERSSVESEYRYAAAAGLPVELVDDIDVPFETFGAVRLADQLQIHPVRYAQGLAAAVDGDGSAVYETSRAMSVKEACAQRGAHRYGLRPGRTRRGGHALPDPRPRAVLRAAQAAALLLRRRHAAHRSAPSGMSISAGSPTRSVRGDGDVLIVGGEGHSAGASQATPERFERLESFAREHWDVERITHRWSAQDPSHYDHLPVIGPYRPGSSRLWVASGFMKWGFSTGTFAAVLLADLINGRSNAWAEPFTPSRVSPRSLHETAELGVEVRRRPGRRPGQAPGRALGRRRAGGRGPRGRHRPREGRRLPRRRRSAARGLPEVHAPGLPAAVQLRRTVLGLSLPRVEVRRRRGRARRPGRARSRAARSVRGSRAARRRHRHQPDAAPEPAPEPVGERALTPSGVFRSAYRSVQAGCRSLGCTRTTSNRGVRS